MSVLSREKLPKVWNCCCIMVSRLYAVKSAAIEMQGIAGLFPGVFKTS